MKINNALRYGILTGIFILPFIPLFIANSMFFPFITGKNFAFRIIVEIVAVLWVVLIVKDKNSRPRFSPLLVSLVVFLSIIGLADIFSPNSMKSFWSNFERMEGFITLIHLALYFIIAGAVLYTEKLWIWLWNTSLVASVLVCVEGYRQLAGQIPINQGGTRVDATLGNATYLGIYVVFHVFLCLFFILRKNTNIYLRYAYGIVALLELPILYHTATRGSILGLLGGLLITALIVAIFEKENKIIRRSALGILVAVAIIIGGFFALKDASFVKSSPVLERFSSISITERTTISRFLIWDMAWKGFKERPILGWGQESFNYVFNKYYDPKMWNQEQWFDRAHNIIFDWLIAGGALGLLSYLSIFVAALYLLWKRGATSFSLVDKSVLTGLLVGYFFNNIFVFDNITSYLLFFTILGFIHHSYCEAHPLPKESAIDSKNLPVSENDLVKHLDTIVAPIAIIVFAFVFYFADWKPIATAQALVQALPAQMVDPSTGQAMNNTQTAEKKISLYKKALSYNTFGNAEIREQLSPAVAQIIGETDVSNDIKTSFFNLTKTEFEKQVAQTPKDARYELFLGSFLGRYNSFDEGLAHLQNALTLSPKKQTIFFEIGVVYLNKKQYDKALEVLKQAYDLAPEFSDASIMYAIGAIYSGKQGLADSLLTPLGTSTVLFDDRIAQAYVATSQYTKLLTIWDARIAANPNDYQSRLSLAETYMSLGRRSEAIAEIQKVIDANPDFKTRGEEYIKQIQSGKI